MRINTLGATLVVMLALAVPARAEDKPDKATDTKIYETLRDVINTGADRFNKYQDYWGCYRLYEGSLMTVKPFLAHRPSLQKAIDDGLAEADRTAVVHDKAFALRRVIDKVREDTNPNPKGPPATAKTLWERLGGEANVKKIVDDLVATSTVDPKVNFFRDNKFKLDVKGVADLKKKIVDMISSLTGGPYPYTGRSMKEAHKGMGITEDEFNAFAGHFKAALEKNGVKADDVKTIMDAVAKTKGDIVEGKPKPPDKPVLWQRMGGEPVVRKAVDDFMGVTGPNPKVDFFRGGKVKLDDKGVADLKNHLVAFLSSVTGGPLKYQGRSMKDAHKGMGITTEQFNAMAKDLKDALMKNGVKAADADELLAIVGTTKSDIVEK